MYRRALFALLLFSVTARADNWPAWRGPQFTGVSRESKLPERWSTTDNIAWTAKLRGAGVSSPIVFGDLVFVTSQEGTGVRRQGNHPSLIQGPDRDASGEKMLTGAAGSDHTRFIVSAFDRASGKPACRPVATSSN